MEPRLKVLTKLLMIPASMLSSHGFVRTNFFGERENPRAFGLRIRLGESEKNLPFFWGELIVSLLFVLSLFAILWLWARESSWDRKDCRPKRVLRWKGRYSKIHDTTWPSFRLFFKPRHRNSLSDVEAKPFDRCLALENACEITMESWGFKCQFMTR